MFSFFLSFLIYFLGVYGVSITPKWLSMIPDLLQYFSDHFWNFEHFHFYGPKDLLIITKVLQRAQEKCGNILGQYVFISENLYISIFGSTVYLTFCFFQSLFFWQFEMSNFRIFELPNFRTSEPPNFRTSEGGHFPNFRTSETSELPRGGISKLPNFRTFRELPNLRTSSTCTFSIPGTLGRTLKP